jgi:hypothetical protein
MLRHYVNPPHIVLHYTRLVHRQSPGSRHAGMNPSAGRTPGASHNERCLMGCLAQTPISAHNAVVDLAADINDFSCLRAAATKLF